MVSFRILDGAVLAVFLFLVAGSIYLSASSREGTPVAEVESVDGRYLFPLSRDTEFSVEGPAGVCGIRIQDGSVFVEHSDCREKICIAMGRISRPPGWIACLPNRVVIRVIAQGPADHSEQVDSVAF